MTEAQKLARRIARKARGEEMLREMRAGKSYAEIGAARGFSRSHAFAEIRTARLREMHGRCGVDGDTPGGDTETGCRKVRRGAVQRLTREEPGQNRPSAINL